MVMSVVEEGLGDWDVEVVGAFGLLDEEWLLALFSCWCGKYDPPDISLGYPVGTPEAAVTSCCDCEVFGGGVGEVTPPVPFPRCIFEEDATNSRHPLTITCLTLIFFNTIVTSGLILSSGRVGNPEYTYSVPNDNLEIKLFNLKYRASLRRFVRWILSRMGISYPWR